MLRTLSRKFKPIFVRIKKSRLKIIKSSGLVPLYNFMLKTPLKEIIDEEFFDKRNQKLIKYLTSEFLLSIILRLIDGSIRLYHFRNKVNNNFFTRLFETEEVPHFTTLIYFLKRNSLKAHEYLNRIMFQISIWILIQEIKTRNLKTITIDVDATAGSVYGKQEGVEKGYNPEKNGQTAYQLQVWTIRETKTLLKVELRNGSVHCSKGFLEDLKILIPKLKKLGVKLRLIADSGYEKYEVFEYLEENRVAFVIAQKQRKTVKTAGKWAKNKQTSLKYDCTLKERCLTYREKRYRQIFIQVDRVYDENGQLCFVDFLADEFTNVFATNMDIAAETIYGLYREHAQVETIIGELKSGLGSVKSRSQSFNVNQSITQLCGIAYNIKTIYASQILKYSNGEIPDIQTIRDKELHVPGYFANHSGKNVFNVIAGSFKDFSRIYERVNEFQPVKLAS
jgi:hypothetical protein